MANTLFNITPLEKPDIKQTDEVLKFQRFYHRWVEARQLCRKLQRIGIDDTKIQKWIENKYYTLTEIEFNQVKSHVELSINKFSKK